MNVNYFDINIVDTVLNTTVLSLQKTAISSPMLIYSGAEDKFQNICTSELTFSFLVTDNEEGKFFELFTSSENRFKVELINSSVIGYPKVVWCGFLLPEQFTEPYVYSNFYVNFTATDGIALLKNKVFGGVAAKTSVLKVISNCLLSTGLRLPILFTEAVQNTAFNLNYLDLEVNTESYIDDSGKQKGIFEILESCLSSIGAKLFLLDGVWYIIGINKFKQKALVFYKYVLGAFDILEYHSKVTYNREIITDLFLASPSLTILPPLKKVTVNWATDDNEFLIPKDVVTHLPLNIDTDVNDRIARYWQLNAVKVIYVNVFLGVRLNFTSSPDLNNLEYANLYKASVNNVYNGENLYKGPNIRLGYLGNATFATYPVVINYADLATNFINLIDPVFIYGSTDLERTGSLNIEFETVVGYGYNIDYTDAQLEAHFNKKGVFTSIANNGSGGARITSTAHGLVSGNYIVIPANGNVMPHHYNGTHKVTVINANTIDLSTDYTESFSGEWNILPFKENFYFAITRKDHLNQTVADEVLYLSNFDDTKDIKGMFDYQILKEGLGVKGTLSLDKIYFLEDGYFNVRLFPIVSNTLLGNDLLFTKLDFKIQKSDDLEFTQTRAINYTAEHSLDVFHSSTRSSLTNRGFLFSTALESAIENGDLIPGQILVTPLCIIVNDVYSGGAVWYTTIEVCIDDADYYRLINGYTLYVLKSGSFALQEVLPENYALDSSQDKKINQVKFANSTGVFMEETDTIYLKLGTTASNLSYPSYWLDKWKRYDIEENKQYYEVLNSMYHDLLFEYNFKVNGSVQALVGPLDIIDFSFKGIKQYYPTNLQLDLTEGVSTITMVEIKNQNVTDYD